jgi:hypothetical protein
MKKKQEEYSTSSKIFMILCVVAIAIFSIHMYIEESNMTFEYTECVITKRTGGRRGGWTHFMYDVDGVLYEGANNGSRWAIVGETYQVKYAKEAPNDYYYLIPPADCKNCH